MRVHFVHLVLYLLIRSRLINYQTLSVFPSTAFRQLSYLLALCPKHRTQWGKHALAAYTWTRTNRGPQKAWLHHIGKSEDPSCSCGHPSQDGDHLVFHCPIYEEQRRNLLPPDANTWEVLDDPHWVTGAGNAGSEEEKEEGTEAFFQQLYWMLKPGGRVEEEAEQEN